MRNLCGYCWLLIPLAPYTRPGEGQHIDGHKCLADRGAKVPFEDEYHAAAFQLGVVQRVSREVGR